MRILLRLVSAALFTVVAAVPVRADSRPLAKHPDVAWLATETAKLHAHVTLFPQSTKWLDVAWLTDLNEAIRAAKEEKRPVLIWVSGDDPLERC
jgi:hypothetical protein